MKLLSYIFLSLFLMSLSVDSHAQYDRFFYDWSSIDQVETLTTKVPGEVVYKSWESNSFLFEYHIRVSNVPRATFLALLKTGRYSLEEELNQSNLHLSVDKGAFRTFISDVGQAQEDIVLTIYHPEEYQQSGEKLIKNE
ncbi:MAG TPA: hypothetical protein VJ917_05950 [Saprospiraceae bacterium]|nr:hypothetical protein [Saprospiraceae bacterium]